MRQRRNRKSGRRLIVLLMFMLLIPAFSFGQEKSAAALSARATPQANEVRALWVVRTTLTSPEKIRTMVERARAGGFNTLIVQVRGRGDAYYTSRWEPRAVALKDQQAAFDPLAVTLAEAKRANLAVHAWVNTSLLANLDDLPTDPAHVYNAHPEWVAVPRAVAAELYTVAPTDPRYRARVVEWSRANRGELEGIYTSPARPEVREHLYSIWMDLLERYPTLDGLHFDYVRLASPDFDYSRASLDRFHQWLEPRLSPGERRLLASALERNPLATADVYAEEFADFQRDQITALVERIYHGVKKRSPKTLVSAAVFANDENARTRRFQDWRRWLAMGILDVVCPMAYSTDTAVFRQQVEVASQTAHTAGRKVWAGIGAYRVPVESAVEKIEAARGVGADGVILFSYDFTVTPGLLNPEGKYLERVRQAAFVSP